MVHSFVRRAHALKNMGVKPVYAPVQQVPRQHVGGGARVCEHAEGRVFTRSRIERPQVVAAVQGKADDFVPGQGQAGAGLLQGTDRRQQPHGLFPQQPHQGGPDAEQQRVAVRQHQHAFAHGAQLTQAGEDIFQWCGQRQQAGREDRRWGCGRVVRGQRGRSSAGKGRALGGRSSNVRGCRVVVFTVWMMVRRAALSCQFLQQALPPQMTSASKTRDRA